MTYQDIQPYLTDDEYAKIMFHTRGAALDLWDSMDLKYGYQDFKLGFVDAVAEI